MSNTEQIRQNSETPERQPRSPGAAYRAIHDASLDAGPITTALGALDPRVDLEEVAGRANQITNRRFGEPSLPDGDTSSRRRMLLYAPLYVSSHCTNHCTYCGFRQPHSVGRRHLTPEQAFDEAEILRGWGFRHLLLVAGDSPERTTPDYFAEIIRGLKARGIDPAVEIAPQSTDGYAQLAAAGACGITLYQETYDEGLYALYHSRGSKARFEWRLEGVERAARAGIPRLGLGILLGLADPQSDLRAMLRHAVHVRSCFPEHRLAFSLPRIHEAPQGFEAPYPIDDETFIRMYCALRIAFPDAELVLSTREPVALRNRLARICITQMSAGSRTVPGGYEEAAVDAECGQQFPVSDVRSAAEVAGWLRDSGLQPMWKVPGSDAPC